MKKIHMLLSLLVIITGMAACSEEQDPNMLTIDKSSDEMVGANYESIISGLESTGFTNIETKVLDDLVTGWLTKDGEIEQVEVNGEVEFGANDSFLKDSKIVVTYHTFPEEEISKEEETAVEEVEDEETTDEKEETTEVVEVEDPKEVLTIENNEDLAALLAVKDEYDPIIYDFVEKYAGETVEFDANIVNMMNHGSATTRYDILLFAGEYSETNFSGPNFKFEDVNMGELNLTGDNIPDNIGAGQNLRITAEVGEFDDNMGILFLTPIETEIK